MSDPISIETAKARHAYAKKTARAANGGQTPAQRQRAFKARMEAAGFVQVHGWIHRHQSGDVRALLHALQADPDLTTGPARSTCSGKLVKVR